MKQFVLFTLILFAVIASSAKAAPVTNPDIELLRKKIANELLAPPVDNELIKNLITTLKEDGSWPNINYVDTSRTAFQHGRHLMNLTLMARAYKKPESLYKGKKDLKAAFDIGLAYWLDHDFINENWHSNEIGTPESMINLLFIMDKDLNQSQIQRMSKIAGRSHINAWGARPSGDRIRIAGIQTKFTVYQRDIPTFEMLLGVLEDEVKFVDDNEIRGMQADFSFHHRVDGVNNTLSYGLSYLDAYMEWANRVAGTRYHFSEKSLNQTIDYYLDGVCKMLVYGKYADPGSANRDISRQANTVRAYSADILESLMKLSSHRKDELQAIVNIRRNNAPFTSSYAKFFWKTEYYIHQRPSYFTSVRMFSSRNMNMEEPYNLEGLLNHHRGDGTNYISVTGSEYAGIPPVNDWQKIPGTTTLQKVALPDETQIQKWGAMDFVGAVTDGLYGAVGFDFISPHDPIRARKGCFFFDDEYVCLGAGVTYDPENPIVTTHKVNNPLGYITNASYKTDLPIVTTLNQAKLNGNVIFASEGKTQTLAKGDHKLAKAGWVFHDGVGYIFPNPVEIRLSNQGQSGSWYDIAKNVNTPKDIITLDVFKLWIEHEVWCINATYEYIVVPGSTQEKVQAAAASPAVEILSNTPTIQAVRHKGLNIYEIVFYKSGKLRLADGLDLQSDTPGIFMIKTTSNGTIREISASDPTRRYAKLHFCISQRIKSVNKLKAVWDDSRKVSDISIDLPQENFSGQSVTVSLN